MMVVQTIFRHMEANVDAERVVNEQIIAMKKQNGGFTRIVVTIDASHETTFHCHISLRGKDKLHADVQTSDIDVIAAVTHAFELLEQETQRKLSKKHHKQLKMWYASTDGYMSDFEELYDIYSENPQSVVVPYRWEQNTGKQHGFG